MPTESRNSLLTFIRRLAVAPYYSELSDGELLQRFVVERDKSAFNALMYRHGPMVLSVCRSILRDEHDAEDVFQATFLVLVRKAENICKPASVASWLHGVAYRLSMRARAESARRRACEEKAVPMSASDPQDEAICRDLQLVLHEEIARLPERYRLPFVLCYLEGKTNQEAADLLGWPKGTILSSLSRARSRLRARLTRRGVAWTGGLAAALFVPNSAPAALSTSLAAITLQAVLSYSAGAGAAGTIAAPAVAYAECMLQTLGLAKLKSTVVVLLIVIAVSAGTGTVFYALRPVLQGYTPASGLTPPSFSRQTATTSKEISQPPHDVPTLRGKWIIESAKVNGCETHALTGRRFLFESGHFVLTAGGEGIGMIPGTRWEGEFFTATKDRETRIDLKPKAGRQVIQFVRQTSSKRMELNRTIQQQGISLQGKYSLDDETLTMHLTNANNARNETDLALILKAE